MTSGHCSRSNVNDFRAAVTSGLVGDPPPPQDRGVANTSHSLELAPSLLAGNHARLGDSAERIRAAGLKWAHLDIMDGHFVPNLTFGPQILKALREDEAQALEGSGQRGLFWDVHLMLAKPEDYIEPFAKAGAHLISIHVEIRGDIGGTLKRIRELGCQNGIVINPGTSLEPTLPYLDQIDLLLLMTVQPGFGGQAFHEDVLPKLAEAHALRKKHGYRWRLEVDGGVDGRTLPLCRQAGADTFVAGSAWFRQGGHEALTTAMKDAR